MSPNPDDVALERFGLLRPHLEDGVALTAIAESTGVPIGTLRRWLRAYRANSLAGLTRKPRTDRGRRRCLDRKFVELIEGLALQRPKRSIASIHRQVSDALERDGETSPSYGTVRSVVASMPSDLTTLAHSGSTTYSNTFELLHRREADAPNVIWQADHTQLDIRVTDESGAPVRPWLTVIIDDYSRAVAAYRLFTTAPSAIQTALTLRDAIWHKADPSWVICGIPATLYTDHGSDFTSNHIERVCADLKIRMIFSGPGRPRGRGRIERFFSTINQRLLSDLPGYLAPGAAMPKPTMSLHALDQAIRAFIIGDYHRVRHTATAVAPTERWDQGGFLPRMPESLEQLDDLLLTVARQRRVQRDGVRLNGLRYIATALAAYVGESVTVRYDPADMAEIRIYHQDCFLCRALCPDLAGETIGLAEIVRARRERRRDLTRTIKERRTLVDALLGASPIPETAPTRPHETTPSPPSSGGLRRYANE